jgi:uncharacterized membrane protein
VAVRPLECLQRGAERLRGSYWQFVGVGALMLVGMYVPLGLVLGPMLVGAHLCFLDQERHGAVRVGRVFDGFQSFLQAWIVVLLHIALGLIIFIPIYALAIGLLFLATSRHISHEVFWSSWILLTSLALPLSMAAYVPFSFAPHLIAERGLSALEAVRVSARAARVNFGGMLALWLLMFGLCFVASIFCLVPVFLVFPVCLAALVEAYRKMFGDAPSEAPPPSAPPAAA